MARRRLLVFGIDGLRADELDGQPTPNIDALGGLYCPATRIYNVYSDAETISGPGWSSILTGAWPSKHGVTDNTFAGSDFATYPDFLKQIKAANAALRVVLFSASWSGITDSIVTGIDVETHQAELVGDTSEIDTDASIVTQLLAEIAANDPDVIFCYLHGVDGEGHDHDWQSTEQRAALANADTQLGRIVNDLSEGDDWMIIVCTDHGGGGGVANNHQGQEGYPETVFVPLVISLREGGAFERFPGAYLVDIASTALSWMGVAVPSVMDGTDLLTRWHNLPPRKWA